MAYPCFKGNSRTVPAADRGGGGIGRRYSSTGEASLSAVVRSLAIRP